MGEVLDSGEDLRTGKQVGVFELADRSTEEVLERQPEWVKIDGKQGRFDPLADGSFEFSPSDPNDDRFTIDGPTVSADSIPAEGLAMEVWVTPDVENDPNPDFEQWVSVTYRPTRES